jgi:hypothetical protein
VGGEAQRPTRRGLLHPVGAPLSVRCERACRALQSYSENPARRRMRNLPRSSWSLPTAVRQRVSGQVSGLTACPAQGWRQPLVWHT